MSQKKRKIKYLGRILVRNPYYLALCLNEQAYHAELGRLKVPREQWPDFPGKGTKKDADGTTSVFYTAKDDPYIIVCIDYEDSKKHSRADVIGLIVHEGAHVWQYAKEALGEDKPSPEFEAYALQNICQNLIAAYYGR